MYPSYTQGGQCLPNGMFHSQLDIERGPLWPLERGFGPSSQLIINGTVNMGANRFNLDLVSTKGVAFHFNPRFWEGVVVRNSQTDRSWDTEERSGVLTLSPGQSFSIAIFCQDSGYQVLVDGKLFTHFKHRHNPLFVTHLRAEGDVNLTAVFYYSKNSNNPMTERSLPQDALDITYGNKWSLSQGFLPGSRLVMSGCVDPYARRFHLNLVSKLGVAFHFSLRFDENVVVRNTKTNGMWGIEERVGSMMLCPGQIFFVEYLCQKDGIQVNVNGALFTHYRHRHEPLDITHLEIEGDAKLHHAYYYPLLGGGHGTPCNVYPNLHGAPRVGYFVPKRASMQEKSNNPMTERSLPQEALDIAYGNKWSLPQGFLPGSSLVMSGCVDPYARRFHWNLVSKLGVAFHFSLRFDENVVVRNSKTNGMWGIEERVGSMMLRPGQKFHVEYLCQKDGIQVNVNGAVTHYRHRHEPLDITHLEIEGDAKLHQAYYFPLQHSGHGTPCNAYPNLHEAPSVGYFLPKRASMQEKASQPSAPPASVQTTSVQSLAVGNGNQWRLSSGFGPGTKLVLKGTVNAFADRFNLDLLSCRGVALHFNPRFNQKEIVRNSFTDGAWGAEEAEGDLKRLLIPGQYFVIKFLCQNEGIQVVINGSFFTQYSHRHDPVTVTHLKIDGEATLHEALYYTANATVFSPQASIPPVVQSAPVQHLNIANGNSWWLSKGFAPGTKLVLHGSVKPNADRFHLNLMSITGVAFHFNPRFNQGVIVRNSYSGGSWGPEELDGGLILSRSQSFIVEFLCQREGIQVVVNGRFFTHYGHRHDPLTITNLKIEGDAKLLEALYHPTKNAATPIHQLVDALLNLGK